MNAPPIGQILSIDRLYSHVETDWIFHCEDDWEFSGEGFIAKSFVLLKQFANFSMVGLRDEKDFRKPFCPEVFESSGVCYRIPDKSHPGMSFNPGLRRMFDYRIVGSYADLAVRSRESIVAALYESLGYSIAYLCEPATHHIGKDAHASDQTRPKQLGPKLKQSALKRELYPKVVRGVKSHGYLVVKLLCLNPVFELYTFYHFPKLPESSQPAPVVLRTQTQLEHYAQHPLSA